MTAGQESVREAPNRTPPDLTPAETRRPRAELDSKRALGTATTWCTRPPPNCRRSMTGPACSTASSPGSATPWSRRDVTPKRGSQNRSAGKPEPSRRLNTPWLGAKLARPRKSRLVMVSRGGPLASSAARFGCLGRWWSVPMARLPGRVGAGFHSSERGGAARGNGNVLLSLRSAFEGDRKKGLDNPHSCWAEVLFACANPCWTARFMKARSLGSFIGPAGKSPCGV